MRRWAAIPRRRASRGSTARNPQLRSLVDLSSLACVGGTLSIQSSDALVSLSGLEGVDAPGDDLEIRNTPVLASLFGLQGLATIGRTLSLERNASLLDGTDLHGVSSVGAGVRVVDNPVLGDVAAQALIDAIEDVGGSVTLGGNDGSTR